MDVHVLVAYFRSYLEQVNVLEYLHLLSFVELTYTAPIWSVAGVVTYIA